MVVQSLKFAPAISKASHSATFSPEPDSGQLQREWRVGQIIGLFGQPLVHASRLALLGNAKESKIIGTCGHTYVASYNESGPLLSWENRLRERLGMVGSTESPLIWRECATPAGQSISRLAPSTRHTNETGSIGMQDRKQTFQLDGKTYKPIPDWNQPIKYWPTPRAEMFEVPDRSVARNIARLKKLVLQTGLAPGYNLGETIITSNWLLRRHFGKRLTGSSAAPMKPGVSNPIFACWLMGWPDAHISGVWRGIQSYLRLPCK